MTVFEAIILAIIEGLTEFLPVSSTGHIVLGAKAMNMNLSDPFFKLYTITIQFGAILSVVVLYFRQFFRSLNFYYNLIVAFIPAAILGALFSDAIDEQLENVIGISTALFVGGIFFLFVNRLFTHFKIDNADRISYLTALKIGFIQCVSMFPGVSRSGATIIGGLSQKLTPKVAAEFSFFLAVPTMFAATCYSIFLKKWDVADGVKQKGYEIIMADSSNLSLLVIGNIVAFGVGVIAIKAFIAFLNRKGFTPFGWYRILLGATLLIIHFFVVKIDFKGEKQEDKTALVITNGRQ